MKNLLALFFALFMLNSINGQEVKNQTEQIKLLPTGKYLTYDVKDKGNGKYYWYPVKLDAELASVEQEKNFTEHKYLNLKVGNSMHDKPNSYLPDNMGFPITLAKLAYEGNAKLQKKVGFVPREIRKGRTNRVVVLDGIIFDLSTDFDPNKPETFKPYRLYVHESYGKENKSKDDGKKKKKKKSFLKKLGSIANVAGSAAEVELNKVNHVENVVSYLKKAVAKQNEVYPKWKNQPKNKARLKNLELKKKLMDKGINDYNEAFKKTDEWKRIQENNKYWAKYEAENETTIKNATGRDIFIYEEGSHNGTRLFNDGRRSYKCNKTYYYSFSGNSKWSAGTKISGTSCGSTATVR